MCISYLKHAVNFREQCLKNALYFRIVQAFHQRDPVDDNLKNLNDIKVSEETEINTEIVNKEIDSKDIAPNVADIDEDQEKNNMMSVQREIEALNLLDNANKVENDKVNKQLLTNFNSTLAHISAEEDWSPDKIEPINTATAALTDDDGFQTGTSSDGVDEVLVAVDINHGNKRNITTMIKNPNNRIKKNAGEQDDDETTIQNTSLNYSNYSPLKKFEKSSLAPSPKNTPVKGVLEQKCPVCFYRFMTPETYQNHLNTCIEYKLVSFAEEVKRLNGIRRYSISPHEYIRRIISCIYKMCQWIQVNYVDLFQNVLLISTGSRIGEKVHVNLDYHQDDDMTNYFTPIPDKKNCNNNTINQKIDDFKLIDQKVPNEVKNKNIINIDNNVLYSIEKSIEKSNNNRKICQDSSLNIKDAFGSTIESDFDFRSYLLKNCSTPISKTNNVSAKLTSQLTSHHKVKRSQFTSSNSMPTSPFTSPQNIDNCSNAPSFSARCSSCNLVFQSLAGFEKHNAKFHNTFALPKRFIRHQTKKDQQQN